jgi:hypothetical protein
VSTLEGRLAKPATVEQSSAMWVDEAIWGHRLYDEQTPWMVFLEFLNVFHHEVQKDRAFTEPNGFNTLMYRASRRLYLRNLLFNNPHLGEIRAKYPHDANRWEKWLERMASAIGIPHPNFAYLKKRFETFDDLCDVVTLVRSTSLEVDSNKRWTSKFVFPYGPDCLYEDLDNKASTNDRRFFGRTGELLYLMLCRAKQSDALLAALRNSQTRTDPTWNFVVRSLQPSDGEEDLSSQRANAFLPYPEHPVFDQLAEDWFAILSLNIPAFDVFPHLVNLAGLHLLKYQLSVSQELLGRGPTPLFTCEVVAPKRTLVRELSADGYQDNNFLPAKAVEAFISDIESSAEWQTALKEHGAFEKCRRILSERALWDEYEGPSDAQHLITAFKQAAIKRHRQHVANIHRNYGREIGLVSKRGTVKLRYAPNDALLKTLLFANVLDQRMELHRFLARLYERYGLLFGDREAEQVLTKGDFDKKAFQANSRRFEQRLDSLGVLKRLSDSCAYVISPYRKKAA